MAILALLALAGCHTVSINADPFVNQAAMNDRSPHSIAILPTTDASGHPQLRAPMRKALYSALAALPFDDRELSTVDDFIARKAVQRNCTPDQLPQELLTDAALADCVVYTEITNVSRLFLLVYSHYRIDLNFLIADTRTRHVLYRNRFIFHDRAAAPPFDVVGLLGSSAFALWHLRPEELQQAMDDGARKIAAVVPLPRFDAASTPNLRLTDVQVQAPRDLLREGDSVSVRVEATPNCRSTFALGRVARDLPLVEVSPGHYLGTYIVRAGDNTPYAMAEVQFRSAADNEALTYTDTRHPFAIDTQPPPRARVSRGRRLDADSGMYLDL
ncbi:MAG: hypothetical protein M1457_02695, partial [bacterium]|nr:hypothetical protein [bacterium]